MKIILIIVFFATSAWSSLLGQRPGARIIGGRDAHAGEFPFAAAIYKQTSDGSYFCGGALLNSQWIITSGSCVDGAVLFSIRLGSNHLDSADALKLTTETYVLHPDYNSTTLENDLGLIKFRASVSFTDYIQPIEFGVRDVLSYALVYTIGWGQVSDADEGLVNSLQTVILTALSNEECKSYFGNQITGNMICVDGNYNQGTCHGDTGGPLIQYASASRATIVGVSSFLSGNGCESVDPSGFTRTFPYINWIRNNTETEDK